MNDYGKKYICSVYDGDVDIATPKQISITTVGKKAEACIRIASSAGVKVELNKTVVLGTGGSVAAGTALVAYPKDQASTNTATTLFKEDYVLGSSGQSAGTTIYTCYINGIDSEEIEMKLKESTAYGLIITAIADNTLISVNVEIEEV